MHYAPDYKRCSFQREQRGQELYDLVWKARARVSRSLSFDFALLVRQVNSHYASSNSNNLLV